MITSHYFRTFTKSWGAAGLLVLCLISVQGCAQYHLDMKDSDPEVETYTGSMIHAFGWGLVYSPQQITTDCHTETGINDVVVKSNYLYSLVAVLTFGIWMPIEIEHRCQAGPGGELPFNGN